MRLFFGAVAFVHQPFSALHQNHFVCEPAFRHDTLVGRALRKNFDFLCPPVLVLCPTRNSWYRIILPMLPCLLRSMTQIPRSAYDARDKQHKTDGYFDEV